MGYGNNKGYSGEIEVEEFLNSIFRDFGYEFMRVGGVERNKKMFGGDVCLDPRKSKQSGCVLEDSFIEVKKRSRMNMFDVVRKAKDDAKWWNKSGAIVFAINSIKGERGVVPERIVSLDWRTFKNIVQELQAYRHHAEEQPPKS